MAVKLRLMRTGKKKQPSYRVVVADSRSPRDGRFIELIGRYDPRQEPSVVEIDNDKAVAWLEKGAQPTDPVRKLLQISGAWTVFTGEAPPVPVATSAPSVEEAPPVATPVSGHQQEIHVVGGEAGDADAPAPTHEEAAAAAAAAEAEAPAAGEVAPAEVGEDVAKIAAEADAAAPAAEGGESVAEAADVSEETS
jgi:small subunit ribosomal protein S16